MKNKQLPQRWKEVELGDILNYEQPTKYIVEDTNYNDNYDTPVLTAGKSFILGYTNEKEGIYNKLPVIIFDDFTTENKFVTFSFKVKSSAMKLLTLKSKDVDLKFIFLLMQTVKLDSTTHKRYYLSKYRKLKIPLPPISTQKKIVQILEKAEQLKQKREQADKLTDEYLKSVFNEMFLKKKNKFEEVELGNKRIFNEFFAGGDVPKDKLSKIKTKEYNIPIFTNGEKNKGFYGYTNVPRVTKPSLTISARGTIGYSEMRKERFYPAIRLIVITPKEKILNLFYLKYVISNINFNLGGTSIPQLTMPTIKRFKIPLPPISLQKKFAEKVEKVEKLKEYQKQSGNEINNLFNALMQKAFNGELTV